MATLGFGILVFITLNNESHLTGGPDGMPVEDLGLRDLARALGLGLSNSEVWYWFMAIVVVVRAPGRLILFDAQRGRVRQALHDPETGPARTTVGSTGRATARRF